MNDAVGDYQGGKIAPINNVLAGSSLRFVHSCHGTGLVRWPTKCRLRRSPLFTLPLNRHQVARLGLSPKLLQICEGLRLHPLRSVLVVPIRLNTGTAQIEHSGAK